MATVNSIPVNNGRVLDAVAEARNVVTALDALEILFIGDKSLIPDRDQTACLFQLMREALELRLRAVERAARGEG